MNFAGGKHTKKGFVLGAVLLAILLIGILATMLSLTGRGIKVNDRMYVDVTGFRAVAVEALRGVNRVIANCPISNVDAQRNSSTVCPPNVNRTQCMNMVAGSINTAVTSPCELSPTLTTQCTCPFHPLYGGSTRTAFPPNTLATGATPVWRLARDVVPSKLATCSAGASCIESVLYISNLTAEACLALEKTITGNPATQIVEGRALNITGAKLPYDRREGCYLVSNATPKYYVYFAVASATPTN